MSKKISPREAKTWGELDSIDWALNNGSAAIEVGPEKVWLTIFYPIRDSTEIAINKEHFNEFIDWYNKKQTINDDGQLHNP